jgi:nucleoside-diphosphate-sugar epimerase
MKIVVIGGTGLIGSKTVAILRQGAHEVVAASPKSGINTITGEGLMQASPRPAPIQAQPRGEGKWLNSLERDGVSKS